jgi:hypothetical protein
MTIHYTNSPIHPEFHERLSVKVQGQLPDFVKTDHVTFVAFLEAYYEYMEQIGKPVEVIGNLTSYANLDKTTDEFLEYFRKQFGNDIPEAVFANANKPFVLKNLRDFYRSKGSEKSFRFLFRLLFKEEIEFYYPSEDMLRVSDGKYTKNKIIRVIDTSGSDAIFGLVGTRIVGTISGAEAIVELILKEKVGSTDVSTLYLSGIRNSFIPDDQIKLGHYTFTVGSMITDYKITNSGNNYSIGDIIYAPGGINNSNAVFKVDSLTTGIVTGVNIVDGGLGYVVGDKLKVSNISEEFGIDGRTASLIVKEIDVLGAGTVTKIEIENSGSGYIKLPTVSGGSGTGLDVTLAGWNISGVKTLNIIDNGFGYVSTPTLDFTSKGDGTAVGTGFVSGYESEHNVGWDGDDGFLSSGKYIQDSHYYQLFSYVITSNNSIANWRDIVKRTVHPAGMAMFGNVQIISTASTRLNAYTFDDAPKQDYTIIFHEGEIEPPVVVKIPVDSCEGVREFSFNADAMLDYLSVLQDIADDPNPNEEWDLVTNAVTSSDDWGSVNTATSFLKPTICQTYISVLGMQELKQLKGLDEYLYIRIGATRFEEFGLLTEGMTQEGDDLGNLTDEIILTTQLRLGPLRRKLDYWKFRKQGGYSQGDTNTTANPNGTGGPIGTESGTAITPWLNELLFDWNHKGGLKQRNVTNAVITQWDHNVIPDISYGYTTTADFLTYVYGTADQVLPPLYTGGPTLQWYQPGGNPS